MGMTYSEIYLAKAINIELKNIGIEVWRIQSFLPSCFY